MPNEPFWNQLQSVHDRIPTIEQRRIEARTSALSACAMDLNQRLHGVLKTLNLGALAQRCSASVPALPSRRAEHLQDRERWQPFAGVYVRAFFVLDCRLDGQRRLALACSEHWNEAQLSWHFDEARFRGFVPTVLLELVPESSVDRQTGQGNSYLLYLHADRIRIADSDALLHIADDLPALRRLSELYDGIAILSQVAREPLPVSPLPSLSKLQAYWQDVALPPAQKESLLRLVLRFLLNEPGAPRSVLLSGPTGVGKSLIAKRLFASTDGGLTDLDEVLNTDDRPRERARILGQHWSVPERFSSGAEECRPNVLLLEDAEQWFPAENDVRTDRLISGQVQRWFVRRWDEAVAEARLPERKRPWQEAPPARVLLVATTRDATALDPAIRARFDLEVTIALPDATLRDALIRQRLDQVPSQSRLVDREAEGTAEEAAAIRAVVSASQGLSGRELCSLFDAIDTSRSRAEHLQTALESLQRRRQQNNPRVDATAGWDRLVLPDPTRETLMDLVFGVLLFFVQFVAVGQIKTCDINDLENRSFFGFYVFRAICSGWRFFREFELGDWRSTIRSDSAAKCVVAASSCPVVLASASFSPSRSVCNSLTSPEALARSARARSCAGRSSASCPRSDSSSVASLSPRWLARAA